jgi:hypothetical protein
MRKNLFILCLMLFAGLGLRAQTVTVSGDITANTTWTNDNIYVLTGGFVYVTNNATLTIQPGTLIKGDASALVITRGAKLNAAGTSAQPIVFTSSQPAGARAAGDWGGLLVFGRAPINDPAGQRLGEGGIDPQKGLYGGTDVNDNSGTIQYVRIEFAGIAYQPNNETNGLTCGGLGLGTTIDHVQVSFGGDDSFEFFGGTVNAKNLISYRGLDDEFDTDYGYSGRLQFCVSLRDSSLADVSGSNGFESDNDATGTTNAPLTRPVISNMTIVGPKRTLGTTVNSNYKRGAHLRRSTSECVYNSLVMGYPVGLKIENQNTANNANSNTLQWKNNILAGCPQALDSTGITGFGMLNWYNNNANTTLTNVSDLMLSNAYNFTNPDFQPMAGSPALAGADFSSPNLNNSFITQTTYRGAFDGTNDWTACWANWDPQNTPYTSAGINNLPITLTVGGPTTFCQGGAVDLSVSGNGTSYLWSNGATTSTLNVTAAGTYTVTVSNSAGCAVVSAPTTVTVNPLPFANFSGGGIFPTIYFFDLSTGGAVSYAWDFGDGSTSTDQNPVHIYAMEDTFRVCLTVTNANGCVHTLCHDVSVSVSAESPIVSAITLSPNPVADLTNLSFVLDHSADVSLSLVSLSGQVVLQQSAALNAGPNKLVMDLQQLPVGMYFAHLKADDFAHTVRVAVMR